MLAPPMESVLEEREVLVRRGRWSASSSEEAREGVTERGGVVERSKEPETVLRLLLGVLCSTTEALCGGVGKVKSENGGSMSATTIMGVTALGLVLSFCARLERLRRLDWRRVAVVLAALAFLLGSTGGDGR